MSDKIIQSWSKEEAVESFRFGYWAMIEKMLPTQWRVVRVRRRGTKILLDKSERQAIVPIAFPIPPKEGDFLFKAHADNTVSLVKNTMGLKLG